MNIKNFINKIYFTRFIIGIITGGIAGFLYYYYIGCNSGSCPITSNPYITILYGAAMGALLMFKKRKNNKSNEIT